MRIIIICLVLIGSLASCRDIKDPELRGIENAKVNGLGFASTTVGLDIRYYNPNRFRATLKEAEGDAWMDSVFLGHFRVDTLVAVPAASEFLVPVNLTIDMKYLLQNSLSAFMNKEVLIRINGTAKAGRNGFYRKFSLKYEGKQNLEKLIRQ